ncbi:hypothetical protein COCVIDRAFT_110099 [Bipolaris victoriae FI3]|uniref:Uncharacterized protein n=1 Tax=Bipolaris victoriae (strain FI3) TaxID=930091 RepID=W7E449_BIPV3|nr:hypothetical protein COCVIDRAFT_110099 [Bipolaris victoriae FI3]
MLEKKSLHPSLKEKKSLSSVLGNFPSIYTPTNKPISVSTRKLSKNRVWVLHGHSVLRCARKKGIVRCLDPVSKTETSSVSAKKSGSYMPLSPPRLLRAKKNVGGVKR